MSNVPQLTPRKYRVNFGEFIGIGPNGNLWVEGDKVISVNKEDQHLSVKGWVRPEDVDAQNQVLSTRIAGARLDYYGVGTVGIKQGPGFGYWLLDVFWPF